MTTSRPAPWVTGSLEGPYPLPTRCWWQIGHLKQGEEVVEQGSTLKHEPGWKYKMLINGFGAVCTAIVMVIFAVTKFREGAWIVLIIIPSLVKIFFTIHHHYKDLASHLSLDKFRGLPPRQTRHRVLMPVSGIHQGALEALRYTCALQRFYARSYYPRMVSSSRTFPIMYTRNSRNKICEIFFRLDGGRMTWLRAMH